MLVDRVQKVRVGTISTGFYNNKQHMFGRGVRFSHLIYDQHVMGISCLHGILNVQPWKFDGAAFSITKL